VPRVEHGREDDFAYWQASLGVNAAIMRALDATEPPYTGPRLHRPLPRWLRADVQREEMRQNTRLSHANACC